MHYKAIIDHQFQALLVVLPLLPYRARRLALILHVV